MLAQQKERLRKEYLARRRALSSAEAQRRSAGIMEKLCAAAQLRDAPLVLSYVTHDNEVDTLPLLHQLLDEGRQLAVPYLESGHMFWSVIASLDVLAPGTHGILVPVSPQPIAKTDRDTVCLVPGVAWSPERYRIGYGGGFFDRFLSLFVGISIGLAFDFQLCEALPRERHDQSVNVLITESQIYR